MTKITQLFEQLELFSEGDPPHHTLFVLNRVLGQPEELLLIDPPADVAERFNLAEKTAVLFTGEAEELDLPQVQKVPNGVAHIAIGQHHLDVYAQQQSNIVHFPALGVVCAGHFGSDLVLPTLGPGSDGSEALETLRLLARLVKERGLQLYIPRVGSISSDRVAVMTRLAEDVGYLHKLRRVIPTAVRRDDSLTVVQEIAATVLPEKRQSSLCREIHEQNVATLYAAVE